MPQQNDVVHLCHLSHLASRLRDSRQGPNSYLGEKLIATVAIVTTADQILSETTRTQKAHESKFVGFLVIRGRPCGIRTCDQRIKSPLLYQLS
jgi:hypothetical protein